MLLQHTVIAENLEELYYYWRDWGSLYWPSPFTTPPFLEAWWNNLRRGQESLWLTFWDNEDLAGVAPLMTEDDCARLVGDKDVSDFQDFAWKIGKEEAFFESLLRELKREKFRFLEIASMRADALSFGYLRAAAERENVKMETHPEEVIPERSLPATWEEYLQMLNKKQRHEVRRKIRRLGEAGEYRYTAWQKLGDVEEKLPLFLDLFKNSRTDKAEFLTSSRERFFKDLMLNLSREKMALLGLLSLETISVAAVICFDYRSTVYLYNSGYRPEYSHLSTGLLSKVFMIEESIRRRRNVFNFLKGEEIYKYRLGGEKVPTYRVVLYL